MAYESDPLYLVPESRKGRTPITGTQTSQMFVYNLPAVSTSVDFYSTMVS
jgi:hypothetical protein